MYRFAPNQRAAGFTLIELLVVIVIIGVLTGIATTSFANAQRNARDNTRKANVGAIAAAVETFYKVNQRFPGKIGNETVNGPTDPTNEKGCLAYDTTNKSIVYYSFPTVADPTAALPNRSCDQRSSADATYFTPSQYSPFPNWLPEMGQYLNPAPLEKRYQDGSGGTNPIDNGGSFTYAMDSLGGGSIQAYEYRKLQGGYMVYSHLENSTADTVPVNVPITDAPILGSGASFTVTGSNIYMIRR